MFHCLCGHINIFVHPIIPFFKDVYGFGISVLFNYLPEELKNGCQRHILERIVLHRKLGQSGVE